MAKNLRWKLLVIVGVVALSVYAFYPPDQKVRLGLDLEGRRASRDARADRRRGAARDRDDSRSAARADEDAEHPRGTVTIVSPTEFRVEGVPARTGHGVPPAADRRRTDLQPRARRRQLHVHDAAEHRQQLREEAVTQALQTIERRVNELGVAEPIIARHSEDDQILVQLPGVTDVARAKQIIKSTALLELKLVEQGPFSDEAQARQAYNNNMPPDLQILPGVSEGGQGERPATVYYVVRRVPAVTGRDLRNSRPSLDENSRPAVGFSLNNEGASKFGAFTQANINRQLASRARQPRLLGAHDQQPHRRRRDHPGQLHAAGGRRPLAGLRSGALPASLTLSRGAHGRSVARAGVDSRRA